MKIITYNVNRLCAAVTKGLFSYPLLSADTDRNNPLYVYICHLKNTVNQELLYV